MARREETNVSLFGCCFYQKGPNQPLGPTVFSLIHDLRLSPFSSLAPLQLVCCSLCGAEVRSLQMEPRYSETSRRVTTLELISFQTAAARRVYRSQDAWAQSSLLIGFFSKWIMFSIQQACRGAGEQLENACCLAGKTHLWHLLDKLAAATCTSIMIPNNVSYIYNSRFYII